MTQSTELSPSLNRSELVPNPLIFTSVLVDFRPRFYLFTSATVQIPVCTHFVAQKLSDMWLSISEIGTEQPRSVKEIAPKSTFFCVNRSIPSGAGARAIRSGFYLGFVVWGRSPKWAKATSFLGGSGGMSPRNVLKWICAEMQSIAFWDTIQ